jgi:hypothetical protein
MRHLVRPLVAALCAATALTGSAAAHELLDHPAPPPQAAGAPQQTAAQGGEGADWEFVGSLATGNPHSDLDFFTRGGETYASVGTLAVGPNGGGQTIVQLTEKGEVVEPRYVGLAPTAFCASAGATGLQHDAEAAPKGAMGVLNTFNPYADTRDAQIVVDATDAEGRCHDNGVLGVTGLQRGGPEIIDVTDPANPQTIGMTSHIGQAHTVNVDPKRPHIAYAVTSDTVTVTDGRRQNEIAGSADRFDLDGFEIVDMSSCMNFPEGTSLEAKRTACRPQVFRYRWETLEQAIGHTTKNFVFGCHELEVYPDDRLTCGNGATLQVFDMAGAFDDGGTPDDFSDDKPRGTPLPCSLRNSSSSPPFDVAEPFKVVDCVLGGENRTLNLDVPGWTDLGRPSLAGVKFLGSIFHEGGHPGTTTDPANQARTMADQDIKFNHEAEFSHSGNLLIATDERGGGITPPGATCAAGNPNPFGNGAIHFYRADRLRPSVPATAEEAYDAYARTPEGEKALFRAPVRTGAQATVCTAHVFQQIPGQNRIFMGWYSQGTQVIDFTENPDGTVTLKEAGHFIPADTNAWVSHIFKAQENPDGTFTYYGATGDFNLGERGRNAVDVYRVTLPAPPRPADGPGVLPQRIRGQQVVDRNTGQTVVAGPQAGAPRCVANPVIRSATVTRAGRRVGFTFSASAPVTIDLFQHARGGRVTGERLVKRFPNVSGTVSWNGRDSRGRRLTDGHYVVRFAARTPAGPVYERRIPLVRRNGRFSRLPGYERTDSCGLLRRYKLFRPVFGGRTSRPLTIAFRLAGDARASIVVRRTGGRVVKRFAEQGFRGGIVHRKRINVRLARRLERGRYTVTIIVRDGGRTITSNLRATRV